MDKRVVWCGLLYYAAVATAFSIIGGMVAVVGNFARLGGCCGIAAGSALVALFMAGMLAMDGAPAPLPSREERKIQREADLRYKKAKADRRVIELERENDILRGVAVPPAPKRKNTEWY